MGDPDCVCGGVVWVDDVGSGEVWDVPVVDDLGEELVGEGEEFECVWLGEVGLVDEALEVCLALLEPLIELSVLLGLVEVGVIESGVGGDGVAVVKMALVEDIGGAPSTESVA